MRLFSYVIRVFVGCVLAGWLAMPVLAQVARPDPAALRAKLQAQVEAARAQRLPATLTSAQAQAAGDEDDEDDEDERGDETPLDRVATPSAARPAWRHAGDRPGPRPAYTLPRLPEAPRPFVRRTLPAVPPLQRAPGTPSAPQVFTITDAQPFALEDAIDAANANPGADTLRFAVPGGGIAVYEITQNLPAIQDSLVFDGTSQCGTPPCIEISGVFGGTIGLRIQDTQAVTIQGVIVHSFPVGIEIEGAGAGNHIIEDSYIGTDFLGAAAAPNGVGIEVAMSNVTIRNSVISGNTVAGIVVFGESGTVISDNLIGTDAAGDAAVPNGIGVQFQDAASSNTVRDNIISGNVEDGLTMISGAFNVLEGNFIGTDGTGTAALPNGEVGAVVATGTGHRIEANVISGNTGIGLAFLGTLAAEVKDNHIGLDASGSTAIGNGVAGLLLSEGTTLLQVGGATAGEGNLIGGNGQFGVLLTGADVEANVIEGNLIGTNTIDRLLGNGEIGILLAEGAFGNTIGGAVVGAGNVIADHDIAGVMLQNVGTSGNLIQGNRIGTFNDGTTALSNLDGIVLVDKATENTIGGATEAARNLISGNRNNGVELSGVGTAQNDVSGNFIGTDVTGLVALPNVGFGVVLAAGATQNTVGAAAGNVIAANTGGGVFLGDLGTTLNTVRSNHIGTDVTGAAALGNGTVGVVVDSAAVNTIGGTTPEAANVISGNQGPGVQIQGVGSDGNVVQGNLIGTDGTGTAALPNTASGVVVINGTGNVIGGDAAGGAGNLISGNTGIGVVVFGPETVGTLVQGNFIGVNVTGDAALPNTDDGVLLSGGTTANRVGGADGAEGNLIGGNLDVGVVLSNAGTADNRVEGNLIGTNAFGDGLGNGSIGLLISDGAAANVIGGTALGTSNVIGFHPAEGISIQDTGTVDNAIETNFIGTNALNTDLGNTGKGIALGFGATDNRIGPGNTIAFNDDGIFVQNAGTAGNAILGNFVGTNANGADLGNDDDGILIGFEASDNIVGGTNAADANVVGFSGDDGIQIRDDESTGNRVEGNFVGTNANGDDLGNASDGVLIIFGASQNTIGGTAEGAGNTVGFNGSDGVEVEDLGGFGNVVAGNFIGVDANGTAIGNNFHGIRLDDDIADTLVGGTEAGAGNTIGFNGLDGIRVEDGASNSLIQGNFIGITAEGDAIANDDDGIELRSNGTTVGGRVPEGLPESLNESLNEGRVGNVIAFNANGIAIVFSASDGNALLGNSIFENDLLGIDLGDDGETENDPDDTDVGPNQGMNFPVIASFDFTAGTGALTVDYTLPTTTDAATAPYYIEFFLADVDEEEGQVFLGSDSLGVDDLGTLKTAFLSNAPFVEGGVLLATATDADDNTSEFSAPVTVQVLVELGLFLHGAYAGGFTMRADLGAAAILPLDQPYAGPDFAGTPLEHDGNEAISAFDYPFAAPFLTDWVLVELRTFDAETGASILKGRQAGLLLFDGTVIDPFTFDVLVFNSVPPGDYHVAVRHRNHLAAMTATPVTLFADDSNFIDLSTSQDAALGDAPLIEVEPDVFALPGGDGSLDGFVSAFDVVNVWLPQKEATGYLLGDFNLDGVADDTDILTVFLEAFGRGSEVPE